MSPEINTPANRHKADVIVPSPACVLAGSRWLVSRVLDCGLYRSPKAPPPWTAHQTKRVMIAAYRLRKIIDDNGTLFCEAPIRYYWVRFSPEAVCEVIQKALLRLCHRIAAGTVRCLPTPFGKEDTMYWLRRSRNAMSTPR